MNIRSGILLGTPVLLFFGWFIWKNVISYQDFSLWTSEIPERMQVLSPEDVSRYRAGDLAEYPGFIYQLTPRTEAQRIREEQFWKGIREERLSFDRSELDSAQQELFDQLAAHESQFLDLPWQWWAMNLFNPMTGMQVQLQEILVYKHHIAEVEDCEGYIYRLREVPNRLQEAVLETRKVAQSGWVMDSIVLKESIRQIRQWAAIPVKQQAMYRSFATRMTRLDPTVINEYQQIDFLVEAASILEQEILPELASLADALEQLPRRAPGMQHLPVNLYDKICLIHTADTLNAISKTALAAADDLTLSTDVGPEESQSPLELLNEIRRSTSGILPAYPLQAVRTRIPDSSQLFHLPTVISGTADMVHFPVYLNADSGHLPQLILDLYQYGLPGAAWLSQLELEKKGTNASAVLDTRARYHGWGLAALELLDNKLLWFSRDSSLLEAFHLRMQEIEEMAKLDALVHRNGELESLQQTDWWQSLSPKAQQDLLLPVLADPGFAAGVQYWYNTWNVRLRACKWDVSCALDL